MTVRSILLLLLFACGSACAIEPMPFKDQSEETRFRTLAAELRCLMCQNQSLADSPSGIAQDLRREVLELMQQGLTDAQIKQHLVERYGDFVLYRTPVRSGTWLLWFGPGALLLIGAIGLAVIVRRRAPKSTGGPPPEPEEPR